MDISQTIIADSTQINADDLIGGPVTVTITDVTKGNAEQPINVHVAEFPDKAYRPSKSMRRVLVAAWGSDSSVYIGRRLTLFRNPDISFGREKVGGIQISAMSDLPDGKPLKIALTVSRGKRSPYVVKPLEDAPQQPAAPSDPPEPTAEQVAAATDVNELRDMWQRSGPERQAQIQARVQELQETAQ